MPIVDAVLVGLTGVLVLPCAVLFTQVMASRLPARAAPPSPPAPSRRAPLAVLVPAHNEEHGLGATLAALRAQLRPGDRLVVVADNCDDDTAGVATSLGAEVVVRHDPDRRGKGYALDCGVRHLRQNAPAIVVIVDADCVVAPGSLDTLARRCAVTGRPVQALYLMRAPPGASLRTRIGELAWTVKNQVRPSGWLRLGLPCQLMGTGMAFPWELLQNAPLATGNIVEDMHLGVALARAGSPPLFCPEARVTSWFPGTDEGLRAQRTRWEHGHVATLLTMGPPLLWQGLLRHRLPLVMMALDLCVPPLASLTAAVGALELVALLVWATTGRGLAAALAAGAAALLGTGVLLAWDRDGRGSVSGRELLSIPLYVAAKLPMYGRLLVQRQTRWVRTKRDTPPP